MDQAPPQAPPLPATRSNRLLFLLLGGIGLLALAGVAVGLYVYFRMGQTNAHHVEIDDPEQRDTSSALLPKVRFTDWTQKSGIRFRHVNGSFGKKLLPETMGGGVVVIDYDNDGHPDLLFVNSCYWPGHEPAGPQPTLALYRNKGDGTFEDVTEQAGLKITLYGMGACVGDYNNDGFPDLFITGVGGNRLFRNVEKDGKRAFQDVTESAGVGGPGGWPKALTGKFTGWKPAINWSSSATFLDYDGDGKLDLFVCNYVTWSPDIDLSQDFKLVGVGRAFGPPKFFEGSNCFLYRNLGEGKFEDVSEKAGVRVEKKIGAGDKARMRREGKSLGVIVCDADEDGWPDIFVANDTAPNFFFHNVSDGKGGRKFVEKGLNSGVALPSGQPSGAMGIDAARYRADHRLGIIITNFANEPNYLLRMDIRQPPTFFDAALADGIAGPSRRLLKFGTLFFDYDLDGRPDLLTCNGHLEPEIQLVQSSQSYKQEAQLFWNSGSSKNCFLEVKKEQAGPDLFKPMVGRGCAYLDLDGNGTLDLVLMENNGPARILKNEGGTGNHWVRLKLIGDGKRSNTSAIGARVVLKAGGKEQHQEVTGARGYLSQSELVLTFGLGKDVKKVDSVIIYWPGKAGGKQEVKDLEVDNLHPIEQK